MDTKRDKVDISIDTNNYIGIYINNEQRGLKQLYTRRQP